MVVRTSPVRVSSDGKTHTKRFSLGFISDGARIKPSILESILILRKWREGTLQRPLSFLMCLFGCWCRFALRQADGAVPASRVVGRAQAADHHTGRFILGVDELAVADVDSDV